MQEACLFYGLVSWSDFQFGLNASAHLPKDIPREPLSLIQQAWQGHFNEKRAPNALCGLFCETPQYVWSVKTCSEENDSQMSSYFCKTKIPDLPLWDYFYRTRLHGGGQTTRPLSDLIMDIAASLVRSMSIIRSCRGRVVWPPPLRRVLKK